MSARTRYTRSHHPWTYLLVTTMMASSSSSSTRTPGAYAFTNTPPPPPSPSGAIARRILLLPPRGPVRMMQRSPPPIVDDDIDRRPVRRIPSYRRRHESSLLSTSMDDDDDDDGCGKDGDAASAIVASIAGYHTPYDRPILASVDSLGLVLFAVIGRSHHGGGAGGDVGIDVGGGIFDAASGIAYTSLPFLFAWMTTSPFTGVYSPDHDVRGTKCETAGAAGAVSVDEGDDENDDVYDLLTSTAMKVGRGWIVAMPLGIALRGIMRGYVPPAPFVIVTLISTFVILVGLRVLYLVAEDFFVEWRNFN